MVEREKIKIDGNVVNYCLASSNDVDWIRMEGVCPSAFLSENIRGFVSSLTSLTSDVNQPSSAYSPLKNLM